MELKTPLCDPSKHTLWHYAVREALLPFASRESDLDPLKEYKNGSSCKATFTYKGLKIVVVTDERETGYLPRNEPVLHVRIGLFYLTLSHFGVLNISSSQQGYNVEGEHVPLSKQMGICDEIVLVVQGLRHPMPATSYPPSFEYKLDKERTLYRADYESDEDMDKAAKALFVEARKAWMASGDTVRMDVTEYNVNLVRTLVDPGPELFGTGDSSLKDRVLMEVPIRSLNPLTNLFRVQLRELSRLYKNMDTKSKGKSSLDAKRLINMYETLWSRAEDLTGYPFQVQTWTWDSGVFKQRDRTVFRFQT